MTVTEQLKIINNKIKANQAQYNLDRLAAKISAYSSGDLRKYEYLTGILEYLDSFNTFTKNKLKQLATEEENIYYKKLSQEIFSYGLIFLGRYDMPYRLLKNLIANKISINTVNDDQGNFVFNLMKGYNVSSFFFLQKVKLNV